MWVKNVKSGSDGGGWLDWWKEQRDIPKSTTVYCSNWDHKGESTNVVARHGGHVKKIDGKASKWYIVPLCPSCNEDKDKEFQVDADLLEPLNND